MGQMDRDFIPSWAVTMWEGDHDIFVALPMTNGGIPYVMKFPKNEGGLSAALNVLNKRKREVLSPTEAQVLYQPPAQQPMVKLSKLQEKLYAETTESQRESARKLLEKLGLK